MRTYKVSMTFSVVLALATLVVLGLGVSRSFSQEPMTGNAFPEVVLTPSDVTLDSLESVADMADWNVQCAEATLRKVTANCPKTAGARAKYMQDVKNARYDLFVAKAESHNAQAAWCYYYAELATDDGAQTKARLSAYKHRNLAGGFMTQAASLAGAALPKIQHQGRLKAMGLLNG